MNEQGIVVGCDLKQEWLLPWWWKHYSSYNSYPVAFVDLGMSEEGISWCQKKGVYISLPQIDHLMPLKKEISEQKQKVWENRYGEKVWDIRSAWIKKPFAFLQSPFPEGIWLDLDCEIRGSLDFLFNYLKPEVDLALARDRNQSLDYLLPGEICYNTGVIVFRKKAEVLQRCVDIIENMADQYPGDQEYFSRAIYIYEPAFLELSPVCNWYFAWGPNKDAIVFHYCGGPGKIEILKNLDYSNLQGIARPKKWI